MERRNSRRRRRASQIVVVGGRYSEKNKISDHQPLLKTGNITFFLNLLKGASNADALADVELLTDKFRDIVVATNAALPNGKQGEQNLRAAFQTAFGFYHELVEFN